MAVARLRRAALTGLFAAWSVAGVATAQPAVGDLDGDGVVSAADEALLEAYYRELSTDPDAQYEPAADLNADGVIDVLDLGIFGAGFGLTGDVDTTPPDLLITLNDVPDDMNDLLVVPPDAFQITLHLDSQGGSAIDLSSLSVTSSRDIGAIPAGTELAGLFNLTPTRAVWTVPAGSDLARTSHYLTVSIDDVATNTAADVYGYAVRDFPFGQPMENTQTLYLDFDGNQGPGSFTEDLREYGLSSDATPEAQALEPQMRTWLVTEVVERVRPYFGIDADGTPGPDAIDVVVTASDPGAPRARLCVGGASSAGGSLLGLTFMDVHNTDEHSDDCSASNGVFPQAIDNLWGSDPDYLAAFQALDDELGGVPVGEDPLDPVVLAPGFDPGSATSQELARLAEILDSVDAFGQVVASAVAHESGHAFGLVAHGPTPEGLFGGSSGGHTDHNVTAGGGTPGENFLMNSGGSFSFGEMTGRGGPLPVFRALAWAYLQDRVVLDEDVTGLFEPPEITSVSPNPAIYPDCCTPVMVAIFGSNFLAPDTPTVAFPIEGSTPGELFNPVVLDAGLPTERIEGWISPFDMALEGFYDVTVLGSDGQTVTVLDALEVRFQ